MAKRYSWLKQDIQFFDSKMMKYLQLQPDGLELIFIYQRLMLLSLRNEGKLIYEHFEETLAEELYLEIESPLITIDAVHKLLDILLKKNLLIQDGEEYVLTEVLAMIGSESDSAERVRKYRERKRQAKGQSPAGADSSNDDATNLDYRPDGSNCIKTTAENPLISKQIEETVRNVTETDCNVTSVTSENNVTERRKEKKREREEKKKEKEKELLSKFSEVILYLNLKTGKRFQARPEAHRDLMARLKEGRTVEECKAIIDLKVKSWLKDPKMREFLRPSTLFCIKHFDEYLASAGSVQTVTFHSPLWEQTE